mmetsp:Transcript_36047/g.51013  ORF Transcript_36047/g.51013 Transcript_36047/m.51013 type:complete len:132 (+) Transcript_36047:290-685(+)
MCFASAEELLNGDVVPSCVVICAELLNVGGEVLVADRQVLKTFMSSDAVSLIYMSSFANFFRMTEAVVLVLAEALSNISFRFFVVANPSVGTSKRSSHLADLALLVSSFSSPGMFGDSSENVVGSGDVLMA